MSLKARALKGLEAELGTAHRIGLPWVEIWRALAECGYEGSYRQFWRMAVRLTGTLAYKPQKAKNLPPLVVGKEEQMARLDREAELNRQREARLNVKKVFIPSVCVGRSED